MSATVQELLSYCLIKIAKISKNKSIIISTHFDSIDSFKNAEEQDYLNIKFANGERALNLNANELARIKTLQHSNDLDGYLSPSQNFTKLYAENFLRKQIDSINSLRIENLNCNPILVTSLKLDTPEKLLTYSVYQSSSRSIVTSFGFFVQELLLSSGENIFDAKDEISHHGTKWDLVKRLNDVQSWIEVKSGPNDLNRTQILSYKTAIESIEQLGEKAYIGETYGTRDQNTVTHGLYRQYLDNCVNRH